MSSETQEQGLRSSGLTLNLSSNNPFRNRAVSPTNLPESPASPFDDPAPPPRPLSRNPFLDPTTNKPIPSLTSPAMSSPATSSLKSPPMAGPSPQMASSIKSPPMTGPSPQLDKKSPTPEEMFDALNITDKPMPPLPGQGPRGQMRRPPPPRGENVPPPGRRPPPHHRPTRSQEEALRARRRMQGEPGPIDPSSPQKRMERRPRRNSESSIVSGDREQTLTDEEKKARDMRRRERERERRYHNRDRSDRDRDRDRSDRDRDRNKTPKLPNKKVDSIDILDATSVYGKGLTFHHDGPFDCLIPQRNKAGGRGPAPMEAFPKDSLNNALGGSGPLNKRPDHATFMGNSTDEAFRDYSAEKPPTSGQPPVWDPTARGSIMHGDQTMGLGTSTFLEGTPAARTVIQRTEAERAADFAEGGGLSRKKSLAQRIRGINPRGGPNREFQPSGRLTNPDGIYASRRSPPAPGSAFTSNNSRSAGLESNPFFAEFDGQDDGFARNRADAASPTSPAPHSLERRATTDATATASPDEQPKQGGGLLARVKSLKGGRRPRPPIPAAAPPPPNDELIPGLPPPGTAA